MAIFHKTLRKLVKEICEIEKQSILQQNDHQPSSSTTISQPSTMSSQSHHDDDQKKKKKKKREIKGKIGHCNFSSHNLPSHLISVSQSTISFLIS